MNLNEEILLEIKRLKRRIRRLENSIYLDIPDPLDLDGGTIIDSDDDNVEIDDNLVVRENIYHYSNQANWIRLFHSATANRGVESQDRAGRVALDNLPFARVDLTSNQSIASATKTIISFDEQLNDTDDFWDSGQPTRLTVPFDGAYYIEVRRVFASNSTGVRQTRIYSNGNATRSYSNRGAASAGADRHVLTSVRRANAGDYFEIEVAQYSGGALDLTQLDVLIYRIGER